MALYAGMLIGRIQEYDITAKWGQGLKPDRD
jgi:hypothetical protein